MCDETTGRCGGLKGTFEYSDDLDAKPTIIQT